MSRRLTTDAKIILTRSGYSCVLTNTSLNVYDHLNTTRYVLPITDSTVNGEETTKLLAMRDFDEFGHPITKET